MGQVNHEPLPEGEVALSFGDGFGLDSLSHLFEGFREKIVRIDGVDYMYLAPTGFSDAWGLIVQHIDDNAEPVGESIVLDFSKIRHIHIY